MPVRVTGTYRTRSWDRLESYVQKCPVPSEFPKSQIVGDWRSIQVKILLGVFFHRATDFDSKVSSWGNFTELSLLPANINFQLLILVWRNEDDKQ